MSNLGSRTVSQNGNAEIDAAESAPKKAKHHDEASCNSQHCQADVDAEVALNKKIVPDFSKVSIPVAVRSIHAEMIANRRHFHKHPELSFEEHETAKYVAAALRSYKNIEVTEGIGRTGVVGVLKGDHPGPCIALRADMDALPITETTTLDFKSINLGVMHACGHDGHMAILLGVAKLLSAQKHKLKGSVKFMFQPAEEGKGGAKEMIRDGVLDTAPRVDEVYGLHLWNYEAVGSVAVKDGPFFAASDKFFITVKGKGGHGAVPQGTHDAIIAACQLTIALQTIVARNIDPLDSAVVTVGQINGGYNYNIIADEVVMVGTVRSLLKSTQALVKQRMQELCDGTGVSYGVTCSLDYQYGYPCTVNRSEEHVNKLREAAKAIVHENVLLAKPTMGAEDMSYFLNARPGCFFLVGSAPSGFESIYPHHRSDFTVHEDSLLVGASVFMQLIHNLLI